MDQRNHDEVGVIQLWILLLPYTHGESHYKELLTVTDDNTGRYETNTSQYTSSREVIVISYYCCYGIDVHSLYGEVKNNHYTIINIDMPTDTRAHTHTYTSTHACIWTDTHTHTHTHTHRHTHIRKHTQTHVCTHRDTHANTHKCMHMHTHKHTHFTCTLY